MEIKIKKEGKTKKYKFISKWADVTLEKWLKLIDLETGSKTKEAEETIAALSTIPKKLIKELALKDVAILMSKIAEMQSKQNNSFKKIIEIEGKEYGFCPDLDSITLGEYADLEHYINLGIEKYMPEIMAILHREITEKENNAYTIAPYRGNLTIRAEKMKKMSAEQVQASLVFFWGLGRKLLEILPLFLMEQLQNIQKQQ